VKLTNSEKTAPIDMLRTVSSSSSVSDVIAIDGYRGRNRVLGRNRVNNYPDQRGQLTGFRLQG
jgi:hypothetical protein